MQFKPFIFGLFVTMLAIHASGVIMTEDDSIPQRVEGGLIISDVVPDGVDTEFLLKPQATGSAVINFSDFTNGPDTGLGDGLGSGTIVTLWGQNLGATQGTSVIEFIDATAVARVPHVYYWKNADGTAPGGPANLYESHRMQEIAISIPDSAMGQGIIRITTSGGDWTSLPFLVRPGNIYHVKSTGSESNPGTFTAPWPDANWAVEGGNPDRAGSGVAPPGSIIYVHDVNHTGDRAIYFRNQTVKSTTNNQMGLTAYPGYQPTVTGQLGISSYNAEGNVVSKFTIFASNCDVDANGQRNPCTAGDTTGVKTNAWGRTVSNYISEPPGRCSSGQQGAIYGNSLFGNFVHDHKIYGNEIDSYGCETSDRLHHTTYMSIRDGSGELVAPWEFGWNYLHDNHPRNGIHNYDQGDGCGDLTGPLLIHDNVVVNQGGAGIVVASTCGWTADAYVYNNVLINVGLKSDQGGWDGSAYTTSEGSYAEAIAYYDSGNPPSGGLNGRMHTYNNTIIGWASDNNPGGGRSCLAYEGSADNVDVFWSYNVCVTALNLPFVGAGYQADSKLDNTSGSRNSWFYSAGATTSPTFDSYAITDDPLLTVSGVQVSVAAGSPLRSQPTIPLTPTRDIYGNLRGATTTVGAVQQ
jgi:hypothetical protein